MAPVRSSAARAAHREQRSLLRLFRASYSWGKRARPPLVHGAISRRTNKAVARACHRRYWPKTNVGASVARDAPRGRRSISRPPNIFRRTPAGHYPMPRQTPTNHHPPAAPEHSHPLPPRAASSHPRLSYHAYQ
ncbi:hypothetical protein PSN_1845 [Pseudomonas sp. NGC7]